jgi:hypothetical protein
MTTDVSIFSLFLPAWAKGGREIPKVVRGNSFYDEHRFPSMIVFYPSLPARIEAKSKNLLGFFSVSGCL